MEGRTYRYLKEEPLYPFGYGLSYTSFTYSNLQAPAELNIGEELVVQVDVENTGARAGDEVVQLYIRHRDASAAVPHHSLQGFARIRLEPGKAHGHLPARPPAAGCLRRRGPLSGGARCCGAFGRRKPARCPQ